MELLPIALLVMLMPMTLGLWFFTEMIMAREIQDLNRDNGWE